jgi:electron transfer flavoprotein alpha subunit
MTVLILLQHDEGKLNKQGQVALAAAFKTAEKLSLKKVTGVVLGEGAKLASEDALSYGIDSCYFFESQLTRQYFAPLYQKVLVEIGQKVSAAVYLGLSSTIGKDLFPRIAAELGAGQASDVIDCNDDGSFKRLMFAGDIIADVELTTPIKVITARGSAFQPSSKMSKKEGAFSEEVTSVAYTGELGEVLGVQATKKDRPDLSDADIVVSGGRALQSKENFEKIMFPLADALGAAIGASRAAVDSGYAPNDWQVGQTGKVVAPNLYISVGISGAIQHLAGMKDSKTIIAINKDPEAPIFEIADYAYVGDLFDVVPRLTEHLKRR